MFGKRWIVRASEAEVEVVPMADRVGLYPGTFDPVTNGHLDIIQRSAQVLERVVVGVAANAGKGPLFTLEERVALAREALEGAGISPERVEVRPFEGLLMHFAISVGARIIIRGLRAVSDFEYEFQMAGMNARLCPEIETVFFSASERCQFISSRFIKEIGRLGGDIASFVPPNVCAALLARFAETGQSSE